MSLKLTPKKVQEEARDFALGSPYSIIALYMGMGKTFVGIMIAEAVKSTRVLVVCPASLVLNWKMEIEKSVEGKTVTVFQKSSQFYYPVDSDYVICSYDLAIKHNYLFEWASVLILDEATRVKDMGVKRTENIHRYIFENNIPRVYLLTGTPIKNRIQEYYSLMAICNYNPKLKFSPFLKKFPDHIAFADYFSYRREFEMMVGNKRIRVLKWEGMRDNKLSELKGWLQPIYFSRKSDREANIKRIPVTLADFDDSKLLEAFEKETKELEGVKSTVKKDAAIKTVPLTISFVEDIKDQISGPIIIFTCHTEPCERLAQYFGTEPITFNMALPRRQAMAKAFQEGKIPVLVCTTGTMAEGFTLTRSHCIVFNDFPWNPGDILQAEYRINREGQTKECLVYQIFASKQSKLIYDIVTGKKVVIDATFTVT